VVEFGKGDNRSSEVRNASNGLLVAAAVRAIHVGKFQNVVD